MKYYQIKKRNPETGRKRLVSYRMIIKTRGLPELVIQLAANKYTEHDAQQLAGTLGSIVDACNAGNRVDPLLIKALDRFPDVKRRLIEKEFLSSVKEKTLAELYEEWVTCNVNSRNWKDSTRINKRTTFNKVFQFFPKDKIVADITQEDAFAFRTWLDDQINAGKMAEGTSGGIVKDMRALFKFAIDQSVLNDNLFKRIKKDSMTNPEREYQVTRPEFERILAAIDLQDWNPCHKQEWRVFLLLQRIGGCRVGETQALQWKDVDFENKRFLVHSSKTERYKGKDKRIVPLFPELAEALPILKNEQERCGVKTSYILTTVRSASSKLRTAYRRMLFNAGIDEYERTFQNLRASAANDIVRRYGPQAESAWIGHSQRIAEAHYLHVLSSEFNAATERRLLE